jgi:hypothetical protein
VCGRCGEAVSPDAQICPRCNNILPAAGTAKGSSRPLAVRFGGSRQTWWSRLSAGGRAAVAAGAAGAVLLVLLLVFLVVVPANTRAQIVEGRRIAKEVLEQGARLEVEGKFQEAYDAYHLGLRRERYLAGSAVGADRDLARELRARARALDYLVPSPRTSQTIWWKPKDQADLEEARTFITDRYPAYRQRFLAVTGAGLEAVRTARSSGDREAYAAKLADVMKAYVNLVRETTPRQRATWSFDVLVEVLRDLAATNRQWDADRASRLGVAEDRIENVERRVREPPITPKGDVFKLD